MSDHPGGIIHKAIDIGGGVVASLPAVFLMLLFINAIFLGSTMWFLERQLDRRTVLLTQILATCLKPGGAAP
jgi:hypothetical protein